jgi:hypothetical protein
MNGGTISGNSSTSSVSYDSAFGGGVVVASLGRVRGTFTMNGGELSGNTSYSSHSSSSPYASYGGGVYVSGNGTFTMSGGTISGNTATSNATASYGGGVYVSGNGTFTKSGGTIYGADAEAALRNIASGYSYGYAVYISEDKKRNVIAGPNVNLDSAQSGVAGGWVDPMPATYLEAALEWLDANAAEGGAYTVTLSDNETIALAVLSYGKTVNITLPSEAGRAWFSCAARWQNGKGKLGPWSDIVHAVVV